MRAQLLYLGLAFASLACGSVQVHPITPPAGGAQAAFDPLVACAAADGLEAVRHPSSVNVEVEGAWVQFMDQETGFNMVILGAADPAAADRARQRGDALYACAGARLAAAPAQATAAPAQATAAPASADPAPASADPAPAAEVIGSADAAPPAPAAPAPAPDAAPKPGRGGFGDALGQAMGAMGKGLGVVAYCSQETACRTNLLMTVCKAIVDESCRNSVNAAHLASTDPEGCRKSIAQMVTAARPHAPPGWQPPPECHH